MPGASCRSCTDERQRISLDQEIVVSQAKATSLQVARTGEVEVGNGEDLTTADAGSLAQPAAYARRVWDDRPARVFLVAGLILTLILFIQVSLIVPTRPSISLGFDALGNPLPPVPSRQMLLLPVLGIFTYVADLLGGMFFYRRQQEKTVAFLLWISSAFTPLMLILAAFFLL